MRRSTVLMMVLALGIVAGCGAKDTSTAPSESAVSSAAPAETTAASNESTKENDLEKIKKNGKIIIATSGTFRPVTFTDDKGELSGFDIEIGTEIAKKLGVKAEFATGNFAGLIPGMIAGKSDLVMSGTIITEERKNTMSFSDKYLSLGTVAMVKKDNASVKDLSDLTGLTVGVISGATTQTDVTKQGGYKAIKEYPGHAEAIADLKAGRIDVYAADSIPANDYILTDKSDNQLKIVGKQYWPIDMAVGLRKDQPELKAAIDAALKELKGDGTLEKILTKWIGTPTS